MSHRTALLAALSYISLAGPCLAASALSVDGRYEYRTDPQSVEMLGSLVCFFPSPASATALPRAPSDKRLAWFCFRNEAQSKSLLKIPGAALPKYCGYSGVAAVTIDGHIPFLAEGGGFDTAVLVSVQSNSAPVPLKCP
jgi:hypothetical protein